MIGLLALMAILQSEVLEAVDKVSVVGANTIKIGETSVRLWGVSPFPPLTSCSDQPEIPQSCDAYAQAFLEDRISSRREGLDQLSQQNFPHYAATPHLRCTILEWVSEHEAVARCEALQPSCSGVRCEDVWYDVAGELIEDGAVTQRRSESLGAYDEEESSAREAELGGWATAP